MRTIALIPEIVVVGSALALLPAGRLPRVRRWLRLAALAAAVVAFGLELWLGAAVGTLFNGGWIQDRFALFAKAALLLGLVVLLAVGAEDAPETRAGRAEPGANAPALAFLVVFGGMVAASASSLVGLWAGLELAALAAVAAAGLSARETGLRLLLLSGLAGALLAVGFAVLYAMAGGASLSALAGAFRPDTIRLPLAFAVLLALTGIVIRLGLAPFQWTGGLLVGVVAVVAAKLLGELGALSPAWTPWLSVLAAFAMVAGGLRAATAASPRTMAAWLVVGQVGWVASALAVHDARGTAAALFLLGGLLIAAVAAPVLAEEAESIDRLAGLGRIDRGRAAGLTFLLLSLAGAPPLAGFFGEFTVAAELVRSDMAWVLTAGLLGSLLSLFGVLRVVRAVYLEGGPEQPRPVRGGARPGPAWTPSALTPAVLVVLYALFANPVYGLAVQGAAALRLP